MTVLNSLIVNLCFTLLLFAGFGFLLYLYFRYKHTYWKRRGVPFAPAHWLFGNVKDVILMRKHSAVAFGDLYRQASENDVFGIYIFHKPLLLVRNPELIKQIFIKDFQIFSNRYFSPESPHDKIAGSNLFSIKNPKWKYLRSKMSPVFTSGKMKKLFHLIVESADSMTKHLEDEFSNGLKTENILVKEVASKYIVNIISSVAFGIRVNSFNSSNNQFFKKAHEGIKLTLLRGMKFFLMFFFPRISPYIGQTLLGSSTDYFRNVFWDSMDSRQVSGTKRGDLIDHLVEMKNEKLDDDFELEGDVLVSQSAIFFIAGHDSGVTTISFALYELAKHPGIQKRTRDEIHEILETQGMTYEAVQNMKYLHQVISETLRLYPTAAILDRVASVDYKIPGTNIVLEKGTPVYLALFGIHRDPKYYTNPDRFDPDRFSDENKNNIIQCTYLPFGDGPRNCIGMRLGLLQSAIGIIGILKDYEVSLDPTYKYDIDKRGVFLSAPDGFKLNLTKL